MRYLKKTNCVETETSWNDKTYFKYGVVSSYKSVTWAVNVQRDYHGKIILVSLYARVCLLYTSPSPRDATLSRMPSSA